MNVFGIGLPEMALIFIVALLVFGPKKLPEIGRSFGKALRSFQDASKEFESEFKREAEAIEKVVKEPVKATLEPPERRAIASGEAEQQAAAEASEASPEIPEASIEEASIEDEEPAAPHA
ncbi:MAG: TatA/E family twin arginine-targeting protein translocase [Elainellaceae cyanobacterium]